MLGKKEILVVNPDQAIESLFVLVLQEEGYAVTTAESIGKAVELLSNSRVDLIITEAFYQHDPFVFDPAFIWKLRKVSGDTPIVLCSVAPSADGVRAGKFGLAAVVRNAFGIDELIDKASRLVGKPNLAQL